MQQGHCKIVLPNFFMIEMCCEIQHDLMVYRLFVVTNEWQRDCTRYNMSKTERNY